MRCGCCCCPSFLIAGVAAVGAIVVGLRGLRRMMHAERRPAWRRA